VPSPDTKDPSRTGISATLLAEMIVVLPTILRGEATTSQTRRTPPETKEKQSFKVVALRSQTEFRNEKKKCVLGRMWQSETGRSLMCDGQDAHRPGQAGSLTSSALAHA
jgi:hypothetical protein